MADHIGMLKELLDYDGESGNRSLNEWELAFIDNIRGSILEPATLTYRQKEKIKEVWDAVFGPND